jgi:hypothetical protein
MYQFRNGKLVYKRYAGLYFVLMIDPTDNELAALESIHLFVEILDLYFHSVCELDLIFNFWKVHLFDFELNPHSFVLTRGKSILASTYTCFRYFLYWMRCFLQGTLWKRVNALFWNEWIRSIISIK